jgi:hypothetical protein
MGITNLIQYLNNTFKVRLFAFRNSNANHISKFYCTKYK